MMMLPAPIWPLAEHIAFGQNCFDGSIGSFVLFCIDTSCHVIDRNDSRYAAIDEAAFKSKSLYNAALYVQRQAFIFERRRIFFAELDRVMQSHEAYRALPAKVSQQVLRQLDEAWTSYFEACQAYEEDPSKFLGHPKLPKYKHKTEGRNVLIYTLQALGGGRSNDRGKGALRR